MNSPSKWITVVSGVLGIWLMVSPLVWGAPPIDTWNDVAVGGAITILAGYNYSREQVQRGPSRRIAGILVLLGAWLLFAPFVNEVSGILLWNDVFVGVLVTALAGYNAYVAPFNEQAVSRTSADET